MDDPWLSIGDKYKTGDTVEGRVVTLTGQGVFVEIEDGVEGFLSAAEVSWTRKTVLIKDTFKKGQALTVRILGNDSDGARLVLGMKQLAENPMGRHRRAFSGWHRAESTGAQGGEFRHLC